MISVAKINKGKGNRDISVVFQDEVLKLTYNRSKYTPKLERELNEQMQANLPGSMLSQFLASLLLTWDAMDVHPDDLLKAASLEEELDHLPTIEEYEKAGIRMVPLPLNQESLDAILSIEAQASIVEALAEDQRPSPKSEANTEPF